MFLHPLISEIIGYSLFEKKIRNFAFRKHSLPYMRAVTYQSILFASTAIKHALDCRISIGEEKRVQFDTDSYKGMHMCSFPPGVIFQPASQLCNSFFELWSERGLRLIFCLPSFILCIRGAMANHPARHSEEDLRNPLQARWECGKRGAKRVNCVGL